jgi:hypothetical protein
MMAEAAHRVVVQSGRYAEAATEVAETRNDLNAAARAVRTAKIESDRLYVLQRRVFKLEKGCRG